MPCTRHLPLVTTFVVAFALPCLWSSDLLAASDITPSVKPLTVLPLVNSLIINAQESSPSVERSAEESEVAALQDTPGLGAVSKKCRNLSRTQVNLIEVPGESFTDAVFDELALTITPDPTKGKAYIRVKPGFAQTGKETGVFFNTENHTYPITFCIKDLPAQVIRLAAKPAVKEKPLEESLPPPATVLHTPDSLEALIKRLVRFALSSRIAPVEDKTGTTFSSMAEQQPQAIPFSERLVSWQGFRVREKRAWSTAGHVIELLSFTNLSTYERRVPYAEAARAAAGTLAVASTAQRLPAGSTARVVLIRSRSHSQTPDGLI